MILVNINVNPNVVSSVDETVMPTAKAIAIGVVQVAAKFHATMVVEEVMYNRNMNYE